MNTTATTIQVSMQPWRGGDGEASSWTVMTEQSPVGLATIRLDTWQGTLRIRITTASDVAVRATEHSAVVDRPEDALDVLRGFLYRWERDFG